MDELLEEQLKYVGEEDTTDELLIVQLTNLGDDK